jgi:thiol-disulfide isomerase/thioredoxin
MLSLRMHKYHWAIISLLFLEVSCSNQNHQSSDVTGVWKAELFLEQDSMILPFFIEFIGSDTNLKAAVWNGDESIIHNNIEWRDDSIVIPSPYFNSAIVAQLNQNEMNGYFVDSSRRGNYRIPFKAKYNLIHRFSFSEVPTDDVDGIWEVVFGTDTDDPYPAIGIFNTDDNSTKGTFITETGDYRYLEGGFAGSTLKLSTFDGSHAFLFQAELIDDTLRGMFYSGMHYKEEFIAWRNDSAKLTDPYTLTALSEPDAKVSFSGVDLKGNDIFYPSPQFENKALLLQVMGSWCPNCMDESSFLAPQYSKLKEEGVEIVALAFERHEYEQALPGLRKMKHNLGINYPVLYAGKASKVEAAKALPFINGVKSYPTLIYIKPNGDVFKIHTGFYGPGTGKYYEAQSKEMNDDIRNLIQLSFTN